MTKTSRPKKQLSGNHENGYCLPPKHGQIKPGEVRNPWGPAGKPQPATPDPFDYATSQPVTITVGSKTETVTAETASHMKNMQAALAGDPRAHKNMQDERRSRRGRGAPEKTLEDLQREAAEEEQKKALSAELVCLLEEKAAWVKAGFRDADIGPRSDFMNRALGDYREKHGKSRTPLPGEPWDPLHDQGKEQGA